MSRIFLLSMLWPHRIVNVSRLETLLFLKWANYAWLLTGWQNSAQRLEVVDVMA